MLHFTYDDCPIASNISGLYFHGTMEQRIHAFMRERELSGLPYIPSVLPVSDEAKQLLDGTLPAGTYRCEVFVGRHAYTANLFYWQSEPGRHRGLIIAIDDRVAVYDGVEKLAQRAVHL